MVILIRKDCPFALINWEPILWMVTSLSYHGCHLALSIMNWLHHICLFSKSWGNFNISSLFVQNLNKMDEIIKHLCKFFLTSILPFFISEQFFIVSKFGIFGPGKWQPCFIFCFFFADSSLPNYRVWPLGMES